MPGVLSPENVGTVSIITDNCRCGTDSVPPVILLILSLFAFVIELNVAFSVTRDGILRERREHARGRNLADCGRICGSPRESFGSIEEMWKKYSK